MNTSKSDLYNNKDTDQSSEINQELFPYTQNILEIIEANNEAFANLCQIISDKKLHKFELLLNRKTNINFSQINPKVINDILLKCISISRLDNDDDEVNHAADEIDGCEFIELLMFKIYSTPCYFVCWDDITCKSIIRIYLKRKRQITPYTLCFLLRSNDINLINQVVELNLVETFCRGDCSDWHLMFVASYQERFFSDCFRSFYEGLLARIILICRLRCSLEQKRYFLTWFAGSLHLYSDEYFHKNDEMNFKRALIMLFEGLILNGLLNLKEFNSLFQMLVKRNEDILVLLDKRRNPSNTTSPPPLQSHASSNKSCLSNQLPILESLFPLTLKNLSRLALKRNLKAYTKSYIDQLSLPPNLKRFLFFENECEMAFKCLNHVKNENKSNFSIEKNEYNNLINNNNNERP
jgi:hypothetical protein